MSDVNISIDPEQNTSIKIEPDKETTIGIQEPPPINLEVLEKGATGQRGLPGLDGTDGREVLLQKTETFIQWKYENDVSWTNLVALADLRGADGSDGADGREVELQVNSTHIQWKYTGGIWTNLIALSALKGDKGDPGIVDPTSLKNATLIEDTTNTDDYEGEIDIDNYFVGLKVNLKVTNANTGASSLNVSSLGAKAIKKNVIDDLEADDIKAGQILPLIYDGTNFQIVGGGGSGGLGSNSFINNETPSGTVDGVNDTFTLNNIPVSGSLALYRDGQLLKEGSDYTLDDDEIVFTNPPEVSSILLAFYQFSVGTSGNADTLDGLDSTDFATITGTETLTNKTLTSPKLNENVALTSTSTELNALDGKTGAWTSYTPTITNLTKGSATVTGAYCQIGKTVLWNVLVVFANDSSIDGALTTTIPVIPKSGFATITPIANAVFFDANVGWYQAAVFSGGAIKISSLSTYVLWTNTGSNIPMDVVSGDYLVINGSYEAN